MCLSTVGATVICSDVERLRRSCLSTVGATVICSDVEPLSAFLCVCLQLVPLLFVAM